MMRHETGDGGGRDDGRDKCLSLPFLENFHENFRVHALSHLRNDPSGFGLRTSMMLCVSLMVMEYKLRSIIVLTLVHVSLLPLRTQKLRSLPLRFPNYKFFSLNREIEE